VNEVRLDLNENPANGLWLWGGGTGTAAESLQLVQRSPGALLSQSRMAHGVALAAGMSAIHLELPWKEALREAAFKVAPLVEALHKTDHLTVYIAAPEELGWYGSAEDKVRALERMDHYLLGPLLSVLDAYRPYRVLLTCDGVVSTESRHPTTGNVPTVLAGAGMAPDEAHRWDEQACALGALGALKPEQAVEALLEENA
jgi:2,3-bisphosphoglycerate-independent phosphoglycerate mutase